MANAPNAARQIRDRALAARTIRVLVTPTPITFAERRSVLQVLEQYGPVEMFKQSPGLYSNFVSATRETNTAERLVANSPLTYNFVESSRSHAIDDIHVADLAEPDSLANDQPSVNMGPSRRQSTTGQDPRQGQEQRQFKLEIFPAPEFRLRFAMAGSPLHDAWPEAYKKDRSFMTTTLQQSLPKTMLGKGLAHWLVDLGAAYRLGRQVKRLRTKDILPGQMKLNQQLKASDVRIYEEKVGLVGVEDFEDKR